MDRKRQADSRGETGSSKTQNNEGLRGSCSLEEQPGDSESEILKDEQEITGREQTADRCRKAGWEKEWEGQARGSPALGVLRYLQPPAQNINYRLFFNNPWKLNAGLPRKGSYASQ